MPNLTPPAYRALYEIYPGKACVNETAAACRGCLEGRIQSIGRRVGKGTWRAPASVPQGASTARDHGDEIQSWSACDEHQRPQGRFISNLKKRVVLGTSVSPPLARGFNSRLPFPPVHMALGRLFAAELSLRRQAGRASPSRTPRIPPSRALGGFPSRGPRWRAPGSRGTWLCAPQPAPREQG